MNKLTLLLLFLLFSLPFAHSQTPASVFVPITPCRAIDTRSFIGFLGGPSLVGETTRTFPIGTACNIHLTPSAYVLNIIVVPRTSSFGFLTIWPSAQPQPNTSTLNSPLGVTIANGAIVQAELDGKINVFVSDNADLIVDIVGYFVVNTTLP